MSDRVGGVPTLETRMDDIRAVMDAAGSERAALLGLGDTGPLCVLFAATYTREDRRARPGELSAQLRAESGGSLASNSGGDRAARRGVRPALG